MSQDSKSQEGLKKLAERVQSIYDDAQDIAPEPDNQFVVTGLKASLRKILNRLNFLAGITHSVEFERLPPIIIGESEAPRDHNIEKDEKSIFIDKVKRLHAVITTIDPNGLLNDYRLPEDQLVIRGVAKLAGIENYEDAELTVEFIEDIQEAIHDIEAQQKNESEIEARIKEETEKLNAGSSEIQQGDGFEDDFGDDDFEEDDEEYKPISEDQWPFNNAAGSAILNHVAASEKLAQQPEQVPAQVAQQQQKGKPGPKPKQK